MKKRIMLVSTALVVCLSGLAVAHEPGPVSVKGIVYAQEFSTAKAMKFVIGGEEVERTSGYILVLDVPLELVQPRNELDPVLMIDDAMVYRLNSGYVEGKTIVLAPKVDLAKAKIWFAAPFNPYSVNKDVVSTAVAARDAAKITNLPKDQVDKALKAGGGNVLAARDFNHVWYEGSQLIYEYSPSESQMADQRVPY